ncbi:MAG: hypothetical protein FVQ85_18765 [Planctomycetes bacterium]|nr:hypothetical protein [Planctomycetota bacterium]
MRSFYEIATELDILKSIYNPAKEDIEKLLRIIKGDGELTCYFYEEDEDMPRPAAGWVKLLEEYGEFEELANISEEIGKVQWLKAKYIAESAKEKPEEVIKIINSVKPKDEHIQGMFLEALVNVPNEDVEKADWIFWQYFKERKFNIWYFIGENAAKLILKISEVNPDKAFAMAKELLEVWLPENKKDGYFQEPVARFEDYQYEELLKKNFKELWEKYPIRATKALTEIISYYFEKFVSKEEREYKSYFYSVIRDFEEDEPLGRHHLTTLVKAICEIGKYVIESNERTAENFFEVLRSREEGIFKRIELYVLRFVKDKSYAGRVNELIGDKKNFDNEYISFDYGHLLRDKFKWITEENKKLYERWIRELKVDDEEDYRKRFEKYRGRKCEDKDIEAFENGLRATRLYPVRAVFPELYTDFKEKSGWSDEDIRPWRAGEVREGSWSEGSWSEGSPKTKEEMLEMSVKDVFEFLRNPENYKEPKDGGYRPNSVASALAYTFQQVVKEKQCEYINAEINEVIELPERFLSKYFYGLSEALGKRRVEDFPWERLLTVARAVVDRYGQDAKYGNVFNPMLNCIREGFEKQNKIEFSECILDSIYEIIKPLIELKEEKEDTLEQDPVQKRCNSFTGDAFLICLSLGIICRRDFLPKFERDFREKIREIFDKVLNNIRTDRTLCTFGSDFARIYWLDAEWVESNIEEILSEELWSIVWNTYLIWGRPSRDLFRFLDAKGIYDRAIGLIEKSENEVKDSREDPDKKLANHIVIAYFNGWLEEDQSQILERFLEKAHDKLRGRAARFFTTGFKSIKEEERHDEHTVSRLRTYWESRLEAISQEPEAHLEEAKALACWVVDSPFPAEETLRLVGESLKISGGKIGRTRGVHNFINSVCDFAKGNELQAVRCIRKMINNENVAIHFTFYEEKLTELINSILKSSDTSKELLQETAKLVDEFGRLHKYEYRDIYGKLVEKSKRMK